MTQSQSIDRVLAMISAIRRRWVARQMGVLLAATAAGALGWLLLMLLADNFVILTPAQFLGGWAVLLIGAGAWMAGMLATVTVRRPSAVRLALLYEQRAGRQRAGQAPPLSQQNRLVNALQFIEAGTAGSDPMAGAAVIENSRRIDPRTAGLAIDRRPVTRGLLALVACGALLGGYVALRPAMASNALARLARPLAPPAHLLATEIVVRPGNASVLEGTPVVIDVELARFLPNRDEVALEYRLGEMGWTSVPLKPTGERGAKYRYDGLTSVTAPISYRVRAGRSTSERYSIDVRYRPRVDGIACSVTRPAYAGGVVVRLDSGVGELSGLEGSTAAIEVACNNELAEAKLEMSDGAAVAMAIDAGSAKLARASFPLAANGSYAVRLTDRHGVTNLSPPRYGITVTPDQAPTAIVTVPGRDLILAADSEVEVVIEATDDIGLGAVVLQARRPKEKWEDANRWEFTAPDLHARTLTAPLSLPKLGIAANQTLLYRVLAFDKRTPQPNQTVGRTWSITAAEGSRNGTLLGGQQKRLLDLLNAVLEMQKNNRKGFAADDKLQAIRVRQNKVRELTYEAIAEQEKSVRPTGSILRDLNALAAGAMLQCIQSLVRYEGPQQKPLKESLVKQMDYIIAQLEDIIRRTADSVALADKAAASMEKLTPQQRAELLKKIKDELKRLRDFTAEQDKLIEGVEEFVRKGRDLTDEDKKKIERLKGVEDEWAKIFKGKVSDIAELAKQDFSDANVASDYKELAEQIEEASQTIAPRNIQEVRTGAQSSVVAEMKDAKDKANKVKEEMEQWLPAGADSTKWVMENPKQQIEVPNAPLPKELFDLVGELVEDQDRMADKAEDETSGNVDLAPPNAPDPTWGVDGGPISTFNAKGKTGNRLPDNNQAGGRSGDGRSGKSQGQFVENVAKGLEGRKPETGITNDTYEKGVVKELQKLATGGATGGGKARGGGQEGLEGEAPPPTYGGMAEMKDWQQRYRQKAARLASALKMAGIHVPEVDRLLKLMGVEDNKKADGRYADDMKRHEMTLGSLKAAPGLEARPSSMRADQAQGAPAGSRDRVLDAGDEAVPKEYDDAVRRYFEKLSENK
jgi:hypothetical protein